MNIKKIVSAVTAFALSATMFAGFSIQANAAELVFSQDYEAEDATAGFATWGTDGRYSATIKTDDSSNHYENVAPLGTANGTYGTYTFSTSVADNTDFRITFDMALTVNSANTRNQPHTVYVLSNASTYSTSSYSVADYILKLQETAYGAETYYINGDNESTITLKSGEWNSYTLEYVGGKTYLTISGTNALERKEIATVTAAGGLKGIIYDTGRYKNALAIDNIVVNKVTAPTYTLDKTEVTVNLTNTKAAVNVTDVVGTVSVESDNTSIATAEYADGVVTINYVADGVANVTVTATNDGLTTTKVIRVTSGSVKKQTVTVNYYITDTENAVPGKTVATISDKVADETVIADEVDLAQTTDDTAKYVYNATASTSLPYTVIDGTNTINLYFDKIDKVADISINYTLDDATVAAGKETFTDKYVGDEYSFVVSKYVSNAGKMYAVTNTKITGTLDGVSSANVPVTLETEAAAQFVEGESVIAFNDRSQANDVLSGGQASGKWTTATEILTVAVDGVYDVTINALTGNYGKGDNVTVYKNSQSDENKAFVIDVNTVTVSSISPVTQKMFLKAGDKILLKGSSNFANIDYILIKKTAESPVVTATTVASTVGATEVTGVPATATLVAEDGTETADQAIAYSAETDTLYTVYVKVDNKTIAQPVITIGGKEYKSHSASFTDTNGIYVYQFINIDPVGATVSYDGVITTITNS